MTTTEIRSLLSMSRSHDLFRGIKNTNDKVILVTKTKSSRKTSRTKSRKTRNDSKMCTKNNCRFRVCPCVCVCCSPTYISCIPIDKICIWLYRFFMIYSSMWHTQKLAIDHCSGGCLGLYVTHICRLIAALDRSILCVMLHVA